MVIVDSSVWVDYFRGVRNAETDWLDAESGRQRLGLTAIILCEVLQGVRDERQAAIVEARLRTFELLEGDGPTLALKAARNYRKLRAHGRSPRGVVDGLIATFCIEQGHGLLHRDRDFDAYEDLLGLVVVQAGEGR